MKYLLALCGLASIGAGAYLAYLKSDGWGWFLFIGFFVLLWTAQIVAHETPAGGRRKKEDE